jgi:hypothetical protein
MISSKICSRSIKAGVTAEIRLMTAMIPVKIARNRSGRSVLSLADRMPLHITNEYPYNKFIKA